MAMEEWVWPRRMGMALEEWVWPLKNGCGLGECGHGPGRVGVTLEE